MLNGIYLKNGFKNINEQQSKLTFNGIHVLYETWQLYFQTKGCSYG